MATDPYALMATGAAPTANVMSGYTPQDPSASIGTGYAPAPAPAPGFSTVAPQANVMSGLDPQTGAPLDQSAPIPQAAPAPSPTNPMSYLDPQAAATPNAQGQLPTQAAPGGNARRPRLSAIDVIGRLGDVFAKVGGAPEQYQPYLDARQQQAQQTAQAGAQLGQTQASTAHTNTENQAGILANQNTIQDRIGMAVRGIAAIKANGGDAAAAAGPMMAQLGIPADQATAIGHAVAEDKDGSWLAGAVASHTDPALMGKEIYGTQPVIGTDGKAYQISNHGNIKSIDLPGGGTAADKVQYHDAGGRIIATTAHNSQPIRSILKTGGVEAGTVQSTDAQGNVTGVHILPGSVAAANLANKDQTTANSTTKTNLAVQAASNKANAKVSADDAAMTHLDNLQANFDNLHKMGALAGEDGSTLGLGRTAIGQAVGAHFGSQAAQERVLAAKNVSQLQGIMLQALPSSASRTKFEQQIQKQSLPNPETMTYSTANKAISQIRETYQNVLREANSERPSGVPGVTAPIRSRPAPRQAAPARGPSVSNW